MNTTPEYDRLKHDTKEGYDLNKLAATQAAGAATLTDEQIDAAFLRTIEEHPGELSVTTLPALRFLVRDALASTATAPSAPTDAWLRAEIEKILSQPENATALAAMGVRVIDQAAPSAPDSAAPPIPRSVALPELPEPLAVGVWGYTEPTTFTAEQMQDYARAAIASAAPSSLSAEQRKWGDTIQHLAGLPHDEFLADAARMLKADEPAAAARTALREAIATNVATAVHDKRCSAALNLSDPCDCGEVPRAQAPAIQAPEAVSLLSEDEACLLERVERDVLMFAEGRYPYDSDKSPNQKWRRATIADVERRFKGLAPRLTALTIKLVRANIATASAAVSAAEPVARRPLAKLNRYCRAGMCLENDSLHEADCPRSATPAPAPTQPQQGTGSGK